MNKLAVPACAAALLAMLAGLIPDEARAQPQQDLRDRKIVHLLQEPRYRTVFKNGDIYLLDVRVNPGDTSFRHTHDAPLITTSISTASVIAGFTRTGENELLYECAVEDDVAYSRPWSARIPFRIGERIFEYVCHEGNYALPDILAGARQQEVDEN